MNLDYYQARQLSADRNSFLEKRKIYEVLEVKNGIKSRTASGAYTYIHTVYRNNLSLNDFRELLKHIKHHLVTPINNGSDPEKFKPFQVERVELESKSIYIFKISWTE